MTVTADPMGSAVPDSQYGWGMVNLTAAVSRTIEGEVPAKTSRRDPGKSDGSGSDLLIVVVCAAVGLIVVGLVVARGRSMMRGNPSDDGGNGGDGAVEPASTHSAGAVSGRT
jgi:hypothetical protein